MTTGPAWLNRALHPVVLRREAGRLTKPAKLKAVVAAVAIMCAGLVAWAFWLEPASLCVRTYRLEIPRWNSALAGLRVAVIGDLHVGSPFNGLDKLRRVVQ